jgi:hypothetical protein
MSEKAKADDQPQLPEQPEQSDVEGHNMWVNPSASREMTSSRSREIERQMRERQRAKEAKDNHR